MAKRSSPPLVDTIFVPEGMEARVVREAVERAGSPIEVITMGIGPERAKQTVARMLHSRRVERALVA
ncbi:MAG TPA: hypothetical protein VGD50_05320, partial [Candidatus Baltobacteraceae bacterium]